MRSATLTLLALLVLGSCTKPRKPTRVVLVTLDSLRYEALRHDPHTGRSGGSPMPRTLRRIRPGTAFTRYYSAASSTQPSQASLLTGMPPWEHGVLRNGMVLGDEHVTLPERFSEHGYETHAVVASYPLHEDFGFAQGFDTYDDEFEEPYVENFHGRDVGGKYYALADQVTERAIDALNQATGHRQFFWFHYFDAHDPYGDAGDLEEPGATAFGATHLRDLARQKKPKLEKKLQRARDRYALDLGAMDGSLARLLDRLEADSSVFETHVVITSDHGESFGESGALGHGLRLTPEQVHVPLWIWSPGLASGVRDDVAGTVDVPRTLLALAGLSTEGLPGRDLAADTRGHEGIAAMGMRRVYGKPPVEILVDGTMHTHPLRLFYVVRDGVLYSGNRGLLYEEDDHSRPLKGPDYADVRAVFKDLHDVIGALKSENEVVDPEALKRLRAIGYSR